MPFERRFTFDGQPVFLLGEKASGLKVQQKEVQDFYVLRQKCLDAGSLFEDPEFPATDESLQLSHTDRIFKWLRPEKICNSPRFFVDGFSRFDVRQGELGDCWLLAAAANLTHDSKLFFRVVCDDNSFVNNYAGIFHFRFWQYGKWVDVVIDDRLPTYRGKLVYMHSTEKNEFWSALLEKAYAKLHGSYCALTGGTICEALGDFTGGVTEMYEHKESPSNLFQILEKAFERNSMMGCFIDPDPNTIEEETPQGLIRGHAYSITKVAMVEIVSPLTSGRIPLLRLRNPWGNHVEWKGQWSDKSPEWLHVLDRAKKEIGLSFDNDGEFWISFRDFLKYFDRVNICNLSPDSLMESPYAGMKKKWSTNVFEGEWVAGVTAGGCRNYIETFHRNPQYVMTLEEPDEEDDKCTALVALMQKNRRSKRHMGSDCLAMAFAIYHVTDRDLEEKPKKRNFFNTNKAVARLETFVNLREVSCRFKLPPGQYLIVPSTFEPDEEGEFLIRVFSEKANTLEENDEVVGFKSIDSQIDINSLQSTQEWPLMEKMFLQNADPDHEIGWMGLKRILDDSMSDVSGSEGFTKDFCRSIVAMLDIDHSGKLGLDEFKTLLDAFNKWKAVFNLYDRDGVRKLKSHDLRSALSSSGYHLNNHILNSLVYRYGSPDQTIAFDDFIMCAVKVKTMIEHFKEKDYNNDHQAVFTMDEWIAKALYS